MNEATPKRGRGRPLTGSPKAFPIHGMVDAQTRAQVLAVTAQRQETQSGFVRRAIEALLQRELQAA